MELRVHGIGGPAPESVLSVERGDRVVRSWRSDVGAASGCWRPARAQGPAVYCWSSLTSGSRAFSLWPLLLPFTLVNVAGWMAPDGRPRVRRIVQVLVRVQGLLMTAGIAVWTLTTSTAALIGTDTGDAATGWRYIAAPVLAALAIGAVACVAAYTAPGFEGVRPPGTLDAADRGDARAATPGERDRGESLGSGRFFGPRSRLWARFWLHVATAEGVVAGIVFLALSSDGGLGRVAEHGAGVLGWLARGQLGLLVVSLAVSAIGARWGRGCLWRWLWALSGPGAVAIAHGLVWGVGASLVMMLGDGQLAQGEFVMLLDVYGYALWASVTAAAAVSLMSLTHATRAERGGLSGLVPGWTARLRGRLALVPARLSAATAMFAVAYGIGGGLALVDRGGWTPGSQGGTWQAPETAPVLLARTTLGWLAVFFVLNTVKSRANPDQLRRIGNVWDVLSFWPRSYHPFAVRPYAERAVPELERLVEQRRGDLVIVAHSQGSVLVHAALLPFTRLDRGLEGVGVVSCGSPLRTLYTLAFPCFVRDTDFRELREELGGAWLNAFRLTDHVGRSLFSSDDADASVRLPHQGSDARNGGGDYVLPDGGNGAPVAGHNDYWDEPSIRALVRCVADRVAVGDLDRHDEGHQTEAA